MKYYYQEHLDGYARIYAEGKIAWNEIHGAEEGFEAFSSREHLAYAISRMRFPASNPDVLEIGCGTGPGACFLASRGFRVDAIDLIPLAIELAKQQAQQRGLTINFWVQDICELPHDGPAYDLIVDSYCLQGIVLDADRACVFAAVRARLKPQGYYVVSTAMFSEPDFDTQHPFTDPATEITYYPYKGGLINPITSIVYQPLVGPPATRPEAIQIGDHWYRPQRKHLKPPALKTELIHAGFDVLYQDGGHLICALAGHNTTRLPDQ